MRLTSLSTAFLLGLGDVLLVAPMQAAPGDALLVTGDNVNLRSPDPTGKGWLRPWLRQSLLRRSRTRRLRSDRLPQKAYTCPPRGPR
jgi:hypothetical protein